MYKRKSKGNTATISGIIEAISYNDYGKPRGIKILDNWYNFSKYTKVSGSRALEKGCNARLKVSGRFINEISVTECPESIHKSYEQMSKEKTGSTIGSMTMSAAANVMGLFFTYKTGEADKLTSLQQGYGENVIGNSFLLLKKIANRLEAIIHALVNEEENENVEQLRIAAQSSVKTAIKTMGVLIENSLEIKGVTDLDSFLSKIHELSSHIFKHIVSKIEQYGREESE